MNVQDIITRVRRVFGDEAAVQVVDADIIRWINDAQIEIVKNNDQALQATGFVNTVAGTSQYALPVDMLILRTLRYKTADALSYTFVRYKNMQEFDETIDGWDGSAYTQGIPTFFTVYEDNAILFPTPDVSTTSGLKVLYNKKPTDVALLSDIPILPAIYHNTIYKYCMWQASMLDEDLEPASMHRTDFSTDLQVLSNNETSDPAAVYPTITVLSYDQ